VRLAPLPPTSAATRVGLHKLSQVLKAVREAAGEDFWLFATPGGFGTPASGQYQVRVEGAELVVREGDEERREPVSTTAGAAELVGPRLLPPGFSVEDLEIDRRPLEVDPEGAAALADWYALGDRVLEALRREAGPDDAPTEPRLWPEHFDLAIESGDEQAGLRVNYGASPGDEDHPQPYFYVGPWSGKPQGGLWNAKGFVGAEISHEELVGEPDPAPDLLEFCRLRREALGAAA
jgi:hypothetical protein